MDQELLTLAKSFQPAGDPTPPPQTEQEEPTSDLSVEDFVITTSDLDHPTVKAYEVAATARGKLPVDKIDEGLKEIGLPKSLLIGGVSQKAALKRAMQVVAGGSPYRDLKVAGTGVYTIVSTDPDRLDLDETDGKGVADAEVTARLEAVGDVLRVRISPLDHPQATFIQAEYEMQRQYYSSTYDLKVWLCRRLLPWLEGVKSPDTQGKYIVVRDEKKLQTLKKVKELFDSVSNPQNKLKIYIRGMVNNAESGDLIADAIADERHRVLSKLERELQRHISGEKTVGKRKLRSMVSEANKLRATLKSMASAFGQTLEELKDLQGLEAQIAMCEVALDDK